MAKYSLDCVASNENNWNFGGFVLSGVRGALQGAVTFGIALLVVNQVYLINWVSSGQRMFFILSMVV